MPVSMPNSTTTYGDPIILPSSVPVEIPTMDSTEHDHPSDNNDTWEVIDLPPNKRAIGSHWIFKTKLKADGSVKRKKARFKQSKADYSLFTKQEGESFTVVLVYLDDLKITGNKTSQIQKFKDQLSSTFRIEDLGDLHYFLGLEVTKSEFGLFVSQKKYTLELLQEAEVLTSKPYKLLMDPNLKLQEDMSSPLQDPKVYKRYIVKLIYLTITRPDICYTVQLLSQFMQNPTSVHMQAVKHLLRYLLNSPGQGILHAHHFKVHLTAYCEIDWASCPMTRRSRTGYCILLGDSPISWKSKNLKDLHPVTLHYQVKDGTIKPVYVRTSRQLADVFTKVLPGDQHHTLLHKLRVTSSDNSQLEGEYKERSKGAKYK
ncbi:retrovirus-related pol polyprotein from transposon TNT 1-94 [Tanacetum coccineum]